LGYERLKLRNGFLLRGADNSHAMYGMHVSKSSGGPKVSWPFGYVRASQAKREIGADAPMFLVLKWGDCLRRIGDGVHDSCESAFAVPSGFGHSDCARQVTRSDLF